MRNSCKIIVFVLLLSLSLSVLVSCSKLEGCYTDEFGLSSYTFDGKKVEISYGDVKAEYLFEVQKRGDKSFMTFYDITTGEVAFDEVEYASEDNVIYLDGVKYIKQK